MSPGVLILHSNILFLQGENSYAKTCAQITSMKQQNSFLKGFLVKCVGYFVPLDVLLKPWFLNSYFQLHKDNDHINSNDQSNPSSFKDRCLHTQMHVWKHFRYTFHIFHQHGKLAHVKDMLPTLFPTKCCLILLFYTFLFELSSHFSYKI
jgi:hypothetical protein